MIVQLIAGTVGALGFGMVFGLRQRYIVFAAAGGFICWAIYLLGVMRLWDGIFWPTVLSAAMTSLFAEIIGKLYNIPATAIYTPAVVPLIPGSTLYYTMNAIVQNDWNEAGYMGIETVVYALGIAIGMSIVYTAFKMVKTIRKMKMY